MFILLLHYMIFETTINSKILKVDEYSISYGGGKLKFNEIIDFDYKHEYINGIGGIELKLYSNVEILILNSTTRGFFSSKTTNNQIKQLNEIYHILYPTLIKRFLIVSMKKIGSGKEIKIARFSFTEDTISLRPKRYLGLSKIEIPNKNAELINKRIRIGLFGGKGENNVIILRNNQTGRSYKYSNSAYGQLNQGQIVKVISLLDTIKT